MTDSNNCFENFVPNDKRKEDLEKMKVNCVEMK